MKIDKTQWPLVSRILSPIRFHRMFLSLKFKLSDGSHASVSQSRLNQFILNELNCFCIEPERQQLASNKQRDVRPTFQRKKARGHLNENLNLAPIGMQIFLYLAPRTIQMETQIPLTPAEPSTHGHSRTLTHSNSNFFLNKKIRAKLANKSAKMADVATQKNSSNFFLREKNSRNDSKTTCAPHQSRQPTEPPAAQEPRVVRSAAARGATVRRSPQKGQLMNAGKKGNRRITKKKKKFASGH